MRHYRLSLAKNNALGEAINTAGGTVYVTAAGGTAKATLYNADGSALANPISISNGKIEFYTADSVVSVDMYGQSPTGHAFTQKAVTPSGNNEIYVGTAGSTTTLIIPFNIANTTANVETDTGFDLPTNALILPAMGLGIEVATLDSGQTILFGTLSSESGGDADGFAVGLSTAAAVSVPANFSDNGTALNGNTYGALVSGYLAGATGWAYLKQYRCDGTAKSISYTLNTGTDTAAGFLRIPYAVPGATLV